MSVCSCVVSFVGEGVGRVRWGGGEGRGEGSGQGGSLLDVKKSTGASAY